MPSPALRRLILVATVVAAASAGADPLPDTCPLPDESANPLADRAGLLAQYERMPHACLQELVRACTRLSNRALLDFGAAAACSFGYEALLSQRFGGNFQALMAWWNSEQAPAVQ